MEIPTSLVDTGIYLLAFLNKKRIRNETARLDLLGTVRGWVGGGVLNHQPDPGVNIFSEEPWKLYSSISKLL